MNLKKISKLSTLFFLVSLVSCGTPAKEKTDKLFPKLSSSISLGEMIEDITASASSALYNAENVINCSGMSGNYGKNHTHSSLSPRETMFLTQPNQKENYLDLTLNKSIQLGHLYIYNYNNFAKIDCSVKTFELYYSYDGSTFYSFDNKTHELSSNEGKTDCTYSLIDGKEYLDLEGLTAKVIRLKFKENFGGKNYGLSEVRLFAYRPDVKTGNAISPTLYNTLKVSYPSIYENIINNSGMSEVNSADAKMSNDPSTMAKSKRTELVIDLKGNYPLSKILFYNYNEPNQLDCGVKDLTISFSIDGKNYDIKNNLIINKASGTDKEDVSTTLELDNINAQFVKLNFNSNYGGSEHGLSEVKFIMGTGYACERNTELTGMLSNYNGWSGADGIFGVRLNGNQSIGFDHNTFFNFSDTYFGDVNPINKHRSNFVMNNNSFAYFNDNQINYVTDYEYLKAQKMESRSLADCFYWLGDGTVIGNYYYVSALYIAKEGVLGFTQKGEDLIRFDIVDGKIDFSTKKEFIDTNTNKLSYISKDSNLSIIFGSAIFENTKEAGALNPDGYIYNFGYRDDKNASYSRGLVVSRVKAEEIEDFSKYEYLSDSGWQDDITKTIPLIDRVSCEMSVTEVNNPNSPYYGKFVLTYEKDTIGNEICVAYADRLGDKFNESRTVFTILDRDRINNVSNYNAKMHPTLSTDNCYVISYNLNESQSGVNNFNADVYRPRFLNLKECI